MSNIFIAPTEIIADVLYPQQHNEHCKGWRFHHYIMNVNKNYQAEIAARQAAKRSAGIGAEGRCHA